MRSVSARLTLLFVLVVAAILGVFSTSLYIWVRDGLSRELDRVLITQARMFQDHFLEEHEEVRQGVHASIKGAMDDFLATGDVSGEVIDGAGRQVYAADGWKTGRSGWRMNEAQVSAAAGERFTIRVAVSEQWMIRALRELRLYFAVFCPLVLAIAWFLGLLFVRRALAPVEEIRRQAERISRANVSDRVSEPRSTGEFRDLACTFNEMLDRLERAIQDLQNFAADAAHELRTPLANLRAEIESAIQEPPAPEESQRLLGSVLEEVSRMSHIVTDLFTLAKIDMRQYAFQKERVSLLPLLEEAREVWGPSAAQRGIEIVLQASDIEVPGDPVALRRVFMNLVENAIKYNRDGGRVTVTASRLGDRIRVAVSDTGIGIPAEHLPRLFKRFYRVDKARDRESGGAGLGLAICKSFIEAHEGRIAVESRAGQGTTFTVELPAMDSAGSLEPAPVH